MSLGMHQNMSANNLQMKMEGFSGANSLSVHRTMIKECISLLDFVVAQKNESEPRMSKRNKTRKLADIFFEY